MQHDMQFELRRKSNNDKCISKIPTPEFAQFSVGAQFSCELFVTEGISSAEAGVEGIDSIEKE